MNKRHTELFVAAKQSNSSARKSTPLLQQQPMHAYRIPALETFGIPSGVDIGGGGVVYDRVKSIKLGTF